MAMLNTIVDSVCSLFNNDKRKDMLCTVNDIAIDVAAIRRANEIRVSKVAQYKKELQELHTKREEEQKLFMSILDHLEDMVWAKDTNGRYIMANKAFREKFCYGMTWDELKGKTDSEIAAIFKKKVGDKNHTFGEVCANSDEVIKQTNKAREFLEYGNINGKLVKLIVNKSPVYDLEGTLFATCGSGRDVTWLHEKLEKAINYCSGCKDSEVYNALTRIFEDMEFKEGDHVGYGK